MKYFGVGVSYHTHSTVEFLFGYVPDRAFSTSYFFQPALIVSDLLTQISPSRFHSGSIRVPFGNAGLDIQVPFGILGSIRLPSKFHRVGAGGNLDTEPHVVQGQDKLSNQHTRKTALK